MLRGGGWKETSWGKVQNERQKFCGLIGETRGTNRAFLRGAWENISGDFYNANTFWHALLSWSRSFSTVKNGFSRACSRISGFAVCFQGFPSTKVHWVDGMLGLCARKNTARHGRNLPRACESSVAGKMPAAVIGEWGKSGSRDWATLENELTLERLRHFYGYAGKNMLHRLCWLTLLDLNKFEFGNTISDLL